MDPAYKMYLLYTGDQERRFRARYAKYIPESLDQYETWFYSFPLYEWQRIEVPPRTAEFTIGMLCLLMREGRANFCIDFPEDGMARVMRYARNREEYDEYIKKIFPTTK